MKFKKFILFILVRSWDGGNNTIDVSAAAASGDRKRRDNRDDWDRELDRGKVHISHT